MSRMSPIPEKKCTKLKKRIVVGAVDITASSERRGVTYPRLPSNYTTLWDCGFFSLLFFIFTWRALSLSLCNKKLKGTQISF